MRASAFSVALLIVAAAMTATTCGAERVVQVWFCLERCGSNRTASLQQLADIRAHNRTVTHIAFEMFDLGENGTLINNGFSNIVPEIKAAGYIPIAMVTTVSLNRMVTMFADPYDFINTLQKATHELGAHGVDFDFEPNDAGTEYQAALYALFLSHISRNFNAAGLTVSADIATWNTIWDFSLIGLTVTDMITTMNTYAEHFSNFQAAFTFSAQYLKPYQWVVGIESDMGMAENEVAERFQLLEQNGVCRVAFWQSPLPDLWWPYVDKLARRCM
jgi:hypothetical protein